MSRFIKEPKVVKITKQHICQGCGKTLKIGVSCVVSEITGTKYKLKNRMYSHWECGWCWDYHEKNCMECGEFDGCIGNDYIVGTILECSRGNVKTK